MTPLRRATSRVTPVVSHAKDTARETLDSAKETLDRASTTLAPVATVPLRKVRRTRRRAAVNVRLARRPPRRSLLFTLVLVAALAGVGYVVYRRLAGRSEPWTPAGTERPAPPVTTPEAQHANTDTAPTAPLASEETVESPQPTTPDEPLQTTRLE